jgi:hypothetical protein
MANGARKFAEKFFQGGKTVLSTTGATTTFFLRLGIT